LGKLYTPEQALAINLVDEIVEQKDLLPRAQEEMLKWCKISEHARQVTKTAMRQDTLSLLMAQKENDIQNFVDFITKESIQKSLKIYLDSLKKPRAK
jgi:3,2-trans-enoyl-CoA isomerase